MDEQPAQPADEENDFERRQIPMGIDSKEQLRAEFDKVEEQMDAEYQRGITTLKAAAVIGGIVVVITEVVRRIVQQ